MPFYLACGQPECTSMARLSIGCQSRLCYVIFRTIKLLICYCVCVYELCESEPKFGSLYLVTFSMHVFLFPLLKMTRCIACCYIGVLCSKIRTRFDTNQSDFFFYALDRLCEEINTAGTSMYRWAVLLPTFFNFSFSRVFTQYQSKQEPETSK